MTPWRSRSIPTQLLQLVAFTASACVLGVLFDYRPRATFTFGHLMRGLVATPLLVGVVGVVNAGLLMLGRFGHAQALALERQLIGRTPRTAQIAAGITAACGEELLLRIFLFGYLALYSLATALVVNGAVTFLLYFRGRARLSWTAVRVIEGSFAALIYYSQHSFVGLMVARGISYAILTAFTLSPYAAPLVAASAKAWRHPHALFRKTIEGTSKRRYAPRSV